MSSKKALFYTFSIGTALVICTWLVGHLWTFIIVVTITFIGIAWNISYDTTKTTNENDKKHHL